MAGLVLMTIIAISGDRIRANSGRQRTPATFRTLARDAMTATQPEVIFVGSSHIYTGVDPSCFTRRVVNLSDSCLNYECAEVLCNHFSERVLAATCVLIELDSVCIGLDTIALHRGDLREFWEWGLTGFDLPGTSWARFSADATRVTGVGRFPPLTPRHEKHSASARPIGPGFQGCDSSLDPAQRDAFFAMMRADFDADVVSTNIDALTRMVNRLQDAEVRVAFVRLPFHPDYWADSIAAERERVVEQALASLAQHGIEPLKTIDLREMSGLTDADFSDWTHLSVSGATTVSRELDRRLNGLLAQP